MDSSLDGQSGSVSSTGTTTALTDADYTSRVGGEPYRAFLARLHQTLKPGNYFEIGTESGATLRLADCPSIAVDPRFRLKADVVGRKSQCLLFQQTSDEFFAKHSPSSLLGDAVDLAFLDGMHLFEFLLRDFSNTERHCRADSIVILHDCLPPGFLMTVRDRASPILNESRFKDWWTGDVWKVVPILQEYRPDLSISLLDCRPTGLVAITNLDPLNTILQEAYTSIVDRYSKRDFDRAEYEEYWAHVQTEPASQLETAEQLITRFRRQPPT